MTDTAPIIDIAVADIRVGGRVRVVDERALAVLRKSHEDHGGFTTPIHVRKAKAGYELIDGHHRLTLAQELGLGTILARVWAITQEQARFFESDANVANAHLTPVALARSLAARQRAYVKLHPETAGGTAGALSKHGILQTKNFSFADFVGAVMDLTPRRVQQIVSVGNALSDTEAERLDRAPRRIAMNDLTVLAKIGEDDERARVVDMLADGAARNAADARRKYAAAQGTAPAPNDPVEAAFQGLLNAFDRAGKPARRRFATARFNELQDLLFPQGGPNA